MAKHAKSTWWDRLKQGLKQPRVRGALLVVLFIALFVVSYNYFSYRQQQGFRIVEESELTDPGEQETVTESDLTGAGESESEQETVVDATIQDDPGETRPDPDNDQGEPEDVTTSEPDAETVLASLQWPVAGDVVQKAGWFYSEVLKEWRYHQGVDLSAAENAEVKAVFAGTVERIEYVDGFGSKLVVSHPGGVQTVYGGLAGILVDEGDRVQKDQVVAQVGPAPLGETGASHVHFEIAVDGEDVNPEEVISK